MGALGKSDGSDFAIDTTNEIRTIDALEFGAENSVVAKGAECFLTIRIVPGRYIYIYLYYIILYYIISISISISIYIYNILKGTML